MAAEAAAMLLLLFGAADDADARTLADCRGAADRNRRAAMQARASTDFYIVRGLDTLHATTVEAQIDGRRSRIRTIHFDQQGEAGPMETDERLNTIVQMEDRQILFNEFRRHVVIRRFDPPTMDVRVFEPGYFERQFLLPAGLEPLEKCPLPAADSTGAQIWIDAKSYWLSTALSQTGWQRRPAPTRPATDGPEDFMPQEAIAYFVRDFDAGWTDEMWFDSRLDHSLVGRRLSLGGKALLESRFDLFFEVPGAGWWPRSIIWKHATAELQAMNRTLAFGPAERDAFEIVYPPAAIVEDKIRSETQLIAGGFMGIESAHLIARIQREYGLENSVGNVLARFAVSRYAGVVAAMLAFAAGYFAACSRRFHVARSLARASTFSTEAS